MKEKLTSALRHALTYLPALGAFLVSKGWLSPDEGATLDKELAEFLSVVAGLIAAGLSRLLMFALAKYAPHLRVIFGGGSGGVSAVAMTAAAWGALALAGGGLLTSCAAGVDKDGNYIVRPDPHSVDAILKYAIRREDAEDAKGGPVEWEYYDPATGEVIPEEDYAAWGIKAE